MLVIDYFTIFSVDLLYLSLCIIELFTFISLYYDSSSQNTKDTLQNGIVILIIGFVLIAAPVVTILSHVGWLKLIPC